VIINLHENLPLVADKILVSNILTKYGSWLNILC